jgi:serine protease Do
MPDGQIYEAESLGRHPKADLGLIKITEKNLPKLPFASIGQSTKSSKGDWCFALGHPNGFKPDRGAVLRIGKLIDIRAHLLWSDCTLLGGDSGGPLFNFKGEVIGIHSRIFNTSEDNIHGPADIFLEHWQEFCQAKTITDEQQIAFLGVTTSSKGLGAKVIDIVTKSAADRAGLKVGDIILSIDQDPTINTQKLISILKTKKVGQQIKLQLTRSGNHIQIDATLGQRPLIIK